MVCFFLIRPTDRPNLSRWTAIGNETFYWDGLNIFLKRPRVENHTVWKWDGKGWLWFSEMHSVQFSLTCLQFLQYFFLPWYCTTISLKQARTMYLYRHIQCIYTGTYNVSIQARTMYLYRHVQCIYTGTYNVSIQARTMYLYRHVQCIYTRMYNVSIQARTMYLYRHVQCIYTGTYNVSIQARTMYLYRHVQCIYTGTYNVSIQACTMYLYRHVQCIYTGTYNVSIHTQEKYLTLMVCILDSATMYENNVIVTCIAG